jgi:DNA-3-methyladenine glycosylase I
MMNQFPYRDVFNAVEQRLIEYGSMHMDPAQIRLQLNEYKRFAERKLTDDDYFSALVFVTFYSGYRAATVTSKREVIRKHFPSWEVVASYSEMNAKEVIADVEMIKNEQKIRACIKNAKTFASLIKEYGSIRNYINNQIPNESFENLLLLKETLQATFEYLGDITVYHFMTDIGLPVLKPDRVISRIFLRLGLLETEGQLLKAVIQGRKFAEATGYPIRYIDIVFVTYGQVSSIEFGIPQGICLEKPRCHMCVVRAHCNYSINPLIEQVT